MPIESKENGTELGRERQGRERLEGPSVSPQRGRRITIALRAYSSISQHIASPCLYHVQTAFHIFLTCSIGNLVYGVIYGVLALGKI